MKTDSQTRILFLCANMSNYFFKCVEHVAKDQEFKVRVIHLGKVSSAPYLFSDSVELKEKNQILNIKEYCTKFNPHICYVAGWFDKDYLRVARILKSSGSKVVAGLDNPWRGTIKQWIGAFLSSLFLKSAFDYLWVAGLRQYQFARKLGFRHNQILSGLYVGDLTLFKPFVNQSRSKVLVFAGRLEEEKGITMLYEVFDKFTPKERNGWTLKIIGNGSLKDTISPTQNIQIMEFQQPKDLAILANKSGAFILPSYFEHWGVAVQEFGAVGLPLIISSEVNSREKYVVNEYNGFVFKAGDVEDLRKVLLIFFKLSAEELRLMGERSQQLAQLQNHDLWKATLTSVFSNETA